MATIIKFKRGLAANWITLDPILEPGEPGFELDTGKLKIGNGIDPWTELAYVGNNGESGESIAYIVNAATHFDFPSIGRTNVIYKAEDEKKIYQWNSKKNFYELIADESEEIDDLEEELAKVKEEIENLKDEMNELPEIQIIHGGNANYE